MPLFGQPSEHQTETKRTSHKNPLLPVALIQPVALHKQYSTSTLVKVDRSSNTSKFNDFWKPPEIRCFGILEARWYSVVQLEAYWYSVVQAHCEHIYNKHGNSVAISNSQLQIMAQAIDTSRLTSSENK